MSITPLNAKQQQQYAEQGFLVLEKAVPGTEINALKSAALEIVEKFDINKQRTVFSTRDRDSGRDDYFFNSAENIHCFLEEDALAANGELLKPAELAINKIGHARSETSSVAPMAYLRRREP